MGCSRQRVCDKHLLLGSLPQQEGQVLIFNDNWQWFFVILTALFVVMAVLNWLFLVASPNQVGLNLDGTEYVPSLDLRIAS